MFNGGNGGASLADIAALFNSRGDGNGFGGDGGGWWALIIILALFGGFGGEGGLFNRGNSNSNNSGCNTTFVPVPMGGYGMMSSGFGFSDAAVQRGFDTQTIISKLDGLNSGVCSLGYDQLAQMNGINTNILQTGYGIQQAVNGVAVGAMQNTNALSTQLANCCCENRQGQAQIEFALQRLGCSLENAIANGFQASMQNDNANYRSLHDEMFAMRMEDKNEVIANLRQQLNNCDRDGALAALESRLVDRISPCSRPAYLTCNPNTGNVLPTSLYYNLLNNNWNNGCGNNCGNCCG